MNLSVITVTYRDPMGLQETIDSLQPLLDFTISWEHIVVDSSPVDNKEILSKLPTNWPIHHMVVPPEGVYAAMNSGIAKASGEILWFLNGGDTLISAGDMQCLVKELAANSGLDMICAGSRLIRDHQDLYSKLPRKTFLESILVRNQLSHQAVLYKKRIFETVGNFSLKYRIAADYEHYFRCYVAGVRARCDAICLVTCDLTGISSVRWRESLVEAARISRELGDRLPFSVYWRHQIYCRLEFARVWIIKFLGQYFNKSPLKSVWLWWNRIN